MKTTEQEGTLLPRPLAGVGLGLRWDFLSDVLERQELGPVKFFEISPENYMRRGGYLPEALLNVADHHPIVTHGLMMSLGSTDPLSGSYFKELRRFLDVLDPPWHSDHLSFSSLDGTFFHDLLPIPFTAAMARHVAARVREAEDRLERRLAVENVSYYVPLGKSEMTEAEFVAEVVEQADCGLLLDLNNLYVNGRNHGFDPLAWLKKLPLSRVVELHVAGPEEWDHGLLLDTHGSPVRHEVYGLLRWVLERTGPVPVLLERDNNIPSLDELLTEATRIDSTCRRSFEMLSHCEHRGRFGRNLTPTSS